MDDISVLNLFLEAGMVVKIVMFLLFIASVLSWIVIVERYNFFRRIKNINNEFLKKFWSGKDLNNLYKEISKSESLYGAMNLFKHSFEEFKNIDSEKDISEFDELNIEKVYIDNYKAPFVKDSLIKIGLHKVEEIKLLNRCRLIVGKVELVVINNNILESDGNIDFSKSTTTCISGCQNYYNVKLTKQKQRVKS